MIIDNNSSCNFKKESNQKSMIEQGLKIIKKSIIFEIKRLSNEKRGNKA